MGGELHDSLSQTLHMRTKHLVYTENSYLPTPTSTPPHTHTYTHPHRCLKVLVWRL